MNSLVQILASLYVITESSNLRIFIFSCSWWVFDQLVWWMMSKCLLPVWAAKTGIPRLCYLPCPNNNCPHIFAIDLSDNFCHSCVHLIDPSTLSSILCYLYNSLNIISFVCYSYNSTVVPVQQQLRLILLGSFIRFNVAFNFIILLLFLLSR